MKRFILTLFISISAVLAFAKPPHLASEELFKGQYEQTKGVKTSIAKTRGQYHRGLTVTGNAAVVKKMVEAINKDARRADYYSDNSDEKEHYTVMRINNNGRTIQVGLQRDASGKNGYLFIVGPEEAFK